MPDRMTVDRDRDGKLYYEYTVSTDDAPTVKGTVVRLKSSDVLHIPGLGFDGLVGYSPIAMAKNAIGMAIACEEYGAKFFANGSDWSIQQNLQNGDVVSGDRTYAFTSVGATNRKAGDENIIILQTAVAPPMKKHFQNGCTQKTLLSLNLLFVVYLFFS